MMLPKYHLSRYKLTSISTPTCPRDLLFLPYTSWNVPFIIWKVYITFMAGYSDPLRAIIVMRVCAILSYIYLQLLPIYDNMRTYQLTLFTEWAIDACIWLGKIYLIRRVIHVPKWFVNSWFWPISPWILGLWPLFQHSSRVQSMLDSPS